MKYKASMFWEKSLTTGGMVTSLIGEVEQRQNARPREERWRIGHGKWAKEYLVEDINAVVDQVPS